MNHKLPRLRLDMPATYCIRLQGTLGQNWSERLGGMNITVSHEADDTAITTLTGPLVDQAALSGVLNCLYDLGLPLLLVECLDDSENA